MNNNLIYKRSDRYIIVIWDTEYYMFPSTGNKHIIQVRCSHANTSWRWLRYPYLYVAVELLLFLRVFHCYNIIILSVGIQRIIYFLCLYIFVINQIYICYSSIYVIFYNHDNFLLFFSKCITIHYIQFHIETIFYGLFYEKSAFFKFSFKLNFPDMFYKILDKSQATPVLFDLYS